jgi:hypothetical protein
VKSDPVLDLPLPLADFIDFMLDGAPNHHLELLDVLDLLPTGTGVDFTQGKFVLLPEDTH